MIEFKNDDEAYLDWLQKNQQGFVLNLRQKCDPGYVVLHRATCGMISNSKNLSGAYTAQAIARFVRSTFQSSNRQRDRKVVPMARSLRDAVSVTLEPSHPIIDVNSTAKIPPIPPMTTAPSPPTLSP